MPETHRNYRDYGFISTFPGPDGNQFVIIAGTRDRACAGRARALRSDVHQEPRERPARQVDLGSAGVRDALRSHGLRRARISTRCWCIPRSSTTARSGAETSCTQRPSSLEPSNSAAARPPRACSARCRRRCVSIVPMSATTSSPCALERALRCGARKYPSAVFDSAITGRRARANSSRLPANEWSCSKLRSITSRDSRQPLRRAAARSAASRNALEHSTAKRVPIESSTFV